MMHWAGFFLLLLEVFTVLTKADSVCNVCVCFETVVNCTACNLQHSFNDSDWPSNKAITDVLFDNNQLVHVTQYPAMSVRRLSLSHNKIVRIDKAAFLNLQNVTELDLSNNFITSDNLFADIFQVKQPASFLA
jgi:hypothetical protein